MRLKNRSRIVNSQCILIAHVNGLYSIKTVTTRLRHRFIMTFGTALHETLQHYITTIYEISGAEADRIDLDEYFEERFRETYLKDYKSNKKVHFSDPVQMKEFFEDGLRNY